VTLALSAWLLADDARALHGEPFFTALAERFIAEGIPLVRLSTSVRTKHPEVFVHNIEWERGRGTTLRERHHTIVASPTYTANPVALIHTGEDTIRCNLEGPDVARFPLMKTLREGGATDYLMVALVMSDGQRTFISWTTDRPGGFTAEEVALFQGLRPLLALRLELEAAQLAIRSLLEVYLGRNAAGRVLSGQFHRGTGELVPCAIVFTDMRGFTEFADRHSPAEVVEALDRFFEVVAGPIHDEGGEVLKFIGDAILAIFRVDTAAGETPEVVCARALRAGVRAVVAIEASTVKVRLGMALHFGEVMYGNIGAQDRLDFTVIGAAVNEACRIEGLCKTVGRSLLLSAAFVAALGETGGGRTESVGAHALKGVSGPVEVYGVRP
jgi:adenylate cyclase